MMHGDGDGDDGNDGGVDNVELHADPSDPPSRTPPPTATPPRPPTTTTTGAATTNATWSWLARFDVLFVLATPYGPLDTTMRALPSGPQLEPYRRSGARYTNTNPHSNPS